MMKKIFTLLLLIVGISGRLAAQNTICPGDTLVVKASSINADGYDWYRNDTLITDVHTDLLRITRIGSYKVVAFNNNGCYSDTSERIFIQERVPRAVDDIARAQLGIPVTIPVASNDLPGCYPLDRNTITIISPPEKGIATVTENAVINYLPYFYASGSDKLLYTIRDTMGNVSNAGTVNISIEERCAIVFPNPFRDKIQVDLINPFINRFKLFETGGKVVHSGEITQMNNTIDLGSFADGIYTLCLYEHGSIACMYKLIKKE